MRGRSFSSASRASMCVLGRTEMVIGAGFVAGAPVTVPGCSAVGCDEGAAAATAETAAKRTAIRPGRLRRSSSRSISKQDVLMSRRLPISTGSGGVCATCRKIPVIAVGGCVLSCGCRPVSADIQPSVSTRCASIAGSGLPVRGPSPERSSVTDLGMASGSGEGGLAVWLRGWSEVCQWTQHVHRFFSC